MNAKDRPRTPERTGKTLGPRSLFARLAEWIHARDEIVRVAIVAAIGTVLAWITYELIFWVNPFEPRATSSWFVAFFIGIFRQHHPHRTISFPESDGSYLASLRRDFVASIGIIVLSTAVNYVATEVAELHHRLAWVLCVAFVAGIEYLLMKFFVFPRRRPRVVIPRRDR